MTAPVRGARRPVWCAAVAAVVALIAAQAPGTASGSEVGPAARGPIEVREEWLLAQGRLVLPAASPDLLAAGRTAIRLDFDWGNDFGWDQDRAGEFPRDRRFLVDGEHRTLALTLRRGLGRRLEAGLRLPLRWRGQGLLDDVIDWWHGFTTRLGLPDGGRSFFETNRFRVEARSPEGNPVAWSGETGTGLGNLELDARFALTPAAPSRWRTALIVRAALPTATGPFTGAGAAGGGQVVVARRLGHSTDAYAGLGATVHGDTRELGLQYERVRAHAYLAFEWRFAREWSLLAQADGASRLVTNLARYPGLQSYLRIGTVWEPTPGLALEAGFSENIADQDATTDFGVFLGVRRAF